jgi:hypothetical protein
MISEQGYWVGTEASSQHVHDSGLAAALINFFKKESSNLKIVDLGCGMGKYVADLRAAGLSIDGFDGNPLTPELTNAMCEVKDLSVPFKFDEPYDWVLSLEVGEHLPPQYETTFLENLHNNNKKGIILSWALKGQDGHGHVNEQNNDYIRGRMAALGYESDYSAEYVLRNSASLWWFKKSIMVFRCN